MAADFFRIDDCTELGAKLHRNVVFNFKAPEGLTLIQSSNGGFKGSRHICYASNQDLIALMRILAERFPLEALAMI